MRNFNNLPDLRFRNKENKLYSEWKFKTIDSIFEPIIDKNHETETVLTIIQGKGTVSREQSGRQIQYKTDSLNTYKKVKKDDLIMHLRTFEGGLEIANEDGIVSPAYTILRKTEDINPVFYWYYFRSYHFINRILSQTVEGIRDGKSINTSTFWKLNIPIPDRKEQDKIADLLTAIDQKVKILSEQLDSLETLKKELLRQIFSQELRFKDENGDYFPDWNEKKIKDLGTFAKGAPFSKADISTTGKTPLILYGELYTKYNEIIKKVFSKTNRSIEQAHLSQKGDILIPISGETPEEISKASCILKSNVVLGGDLLIFRPSDIIGQYFSFLINSNLKNKIARIAQGKSIVHIKEKDFGGISIKVPDEMEQKKISDFCISLNDKLDLIKEKIKDWEEIKKGLLQQLFPN